MVCDLGIPVYLSRMLVEDNYRFFSCHQICTKGAAGAKTTTLAEVCREERGVLFFCMFMVEFSCYHHLGACDVPTRV